MRTFFSLKTHTKNEKMICSLMSLSPILLLSILHITSFLWLLHLLSIFSFKKMNKVWQEKSFYTEERESDKKSRKETYWKYQISFLLKVFLFYLKRGEKKEKSEGKSFDLHFISFWRNIKKKKWKGKQACDAYIKCIISGVLFTYHMESYAKLNLNPPINRNKLN